MNRLFCSGLFAFGLLVASNAVDAKITMVAEINFLEVENPGVVRTHVAAKVAISFLVDWELADANDNIKIIRIGTSGLLIKRLDGLRMDGLPIRTKNYLSGDSGLTLTLLDPIVGVGKTRCDLVLGVRTPHRSALHVMGVNVFNSQKIKIARAISGQVDGIDNNDSLKFEVIFDSIKPPPVKGFTVENSNDNKGYVILNWKKSENVEVDGYFIFRNVNPQTTLYPTFKVGNRSRTFWLLDTEVQRGLNIYSIVSYKNTGFGTILSLRSAPIIKTLFVEPTRVEKHISLLWGLVKTRGWEEVRYAY